MPKKAAKTYAKRKRVRRNKQKGNRQYKDSVFRMIYKEALHTAELYYGLTGKNAKPSEIIFEPTNALFVKQLNHDVAFRVADRSIFITEEQSTPNENMPVRILVYAAELYDRYIRSLPNNAIYKARRINLPTPYFYVLLYGKPQDTPIQELRLSDAFNDNDDVNLELIVKVHNLNSAGENDLLRKCPILQGYVDLVRYVESNRHELGLDMAIKAAIDYCKENTALRQFLTEHENEVKENMLWEWDETAYRKVMADEAREEGRKEGRQEGRQEGRKEGRQEGRKEGRLSNLLENLRNMMETLNLTAEKAMDALKVPAAERKALLAQL